MSLAREVNVAHKATYNKVAKCAVRLFVVALAIELALCAAFASTSWALEDNSSSSPNIKVTYDGTSLIWSGVEIDGDGNVSLDLFSKSYTLDGQLIAATTGKSAIVAPGTSGVVNIIFVNATNQPVSVKSTFEQSAVVTGAGVTYNIAPFENIIFESDTSEQAATLESSSDSMLDESSAQKTYTAIQSVDAGASASGAISWQWPFDSYDTDDTFYGDMAASGEPIKVTMSLDLEVEQDLQNAQNQTETHNVLAGSSLVQTGDTAPLIWLSVISTLTLFALIALILEVRNDNQVKK
jgi:hypothetical protein